LVVDARDWTVASAFDVATEDLADARWSPDSTSIAVHDAPHANKGAMLYSPDGRLLGECEPDGDSKDPSNVKTNQAARVGVTRVRWSSGGSFLAAGGRDRRCRVVNHVSWRAFADLGHADRVVAPATVAVYEETEDARVEGWASRRIPATKTRTKTRRARRMRRETSTRTPPGRASGGTTLWTATNRVSVRKTPCVSPPGENASSRAAHSFRGTSCARCRRLCRLKSEYVRRLRGTTRSLPKSLAKAFQKSLGLSTTAFWRRATRGHQERCGSGTW
jgi:hypothetical protein